MENDPRVPVHNEIDKALDRLQAFDKVAESSFDSLHERLQELEDQLQEAGDSYDYEAVKDTNEGDHPPIFDEEQQEKMTSMMQECRTICNAISYKHRELHSVVSKVGKAIDKNFESSYDFMQSSTPFLRDETRPKLHEVVCNHLCREGMQEVADELMKESNLSMLSEHIENFHDVNFIVNALRSKDLKPAMTWVTQNKDKLDEMKSSLEFKLHRLAFISMLEEGSPNIASAVEYARHNLQPYFKQHEEAIQQAMGALVFMRCGLSGTPYNELLKPTQGDDVIHTFTKDACSIKGLACNSSLAICINAGCIALPVLLNIKQALSETQVHNMWTGEDELPIEIGLGESSEYHSIFACPILRQQSTENNPPMRLVCGHIISKDALTKLTGQTKKMKCPYCPVEQGNMEPKQIFF